MHMSMFIMNENFETVNVKGFNLTRGALKHIKECCKKGLIEVENKTYKILGYEFVKYNSQISYQNIGYISVIPL